MSNVVYTALLKRPDSINWSKWKA